MHILQCVNFEHTQYKVGGNDDNFLYDGLGLESILVNVGILSDEFRDLPQMN